MEIRLNPVSRLVLLAAAAFAPASIAATFAVDGLFDDSLAHDASPGDGVCLDGGGDCTLRAAIEEANALAGADSIEFLVAGTILVATSEGQLPTVTDQLTIDGSTAPGYPGASDDLEDAPPAIYLDGVAIGGVAGSASGLRFGAGSEYSTVLAVGIIRFAYGIEFASSASYFFVDLCYVGVMGDGTAAGNAIGVSIDGNDSVVMGKSPNGAGGSYGHGNVISANTVAGIRILHAIDIYAGGNRIGTTPDGLAARSNGIGIDALDVSDSLIGGFGNLISGNLEDAIHFQASIDNYFQGNIVGMDQSGAPLANGGRGIRVQGSGNMIGGSEAEGANWIANNTDGVIVDGDNNTIVGNVIGSITTTAQGNSGDGIRIDSGVGNTISSNQVLNNGRDGINTLGDSTTIEGNQIGWLDFAVGGIQDFGNGSVGIHLQSSNNDVTANNVGFSASAGVVLVGDANSISGNFIGVTSHGENVANESDGVAIVGSSAGNLVIENTIAFNHEGIYVAPESGIDNALYFNSIFSNRDFGIDLLGDHATPNDPGDPDTGPNKLQNFPEIVSLSFDGGASPPELTVEWSIDSTTANSSYQIYADFYLADSATSGQGKTWFGSDVAGTPAMTNVVTLTLPPGTTGGNLVATATDGDGLGSTSEFSAPIAFGISDTIFENGFETP